MDQLQFISDPKEEEPLPIPRPSGVKEQSDERRLWVGNLDPRITEFSLIKVLQKYGKIANFDFLFHKAGPQQGQPRGYCFVTYEEASDAKKALSLLNGKLALNRRIAVKLANERQDDDYTSESTSASTSSHVEKSKPVSTSVDVNSKINEIERKLDKMKRNDVTEESIPIGRIILENQQHHKPQQYYRARESRKPYSRRPHPKHRSRR